VLHVDPLPSCCGGCVFINPFIITLLLLVTSCTVMIIIRDLFRGGEPLRISIIIYNSLRYGQELIVQYMIFLAVAKVGFVC
jgi:hypothetical protein